MGPLLAPDFTVPANRQLAVWLVTNFRFWIKPHPLQNVKEDADPTDFEALVALVAHRAGGEVFHPILVLGSIAAVNEIDDFVDVQTRMVHWFSPWLKNKKTGQGQLRSSLFI